MRQEGARITAQDNSRRRFLQSIHNDVTLKWLSEAMQNEGGVAAAFDAAGARRCRGHTKSCNDECRAARVSPMEATPVIITGMSAQKS